MAKAKPKKTEKKTPAKSPMTKKKAPPSPKKSNKKELSPAEARQALQDSINAQFKGRVVLQRGDEFSNVFMIRRPTGLTSIDVALGGGFPAGGMSELIGKEGAGKDYLANLVISNLQKTYKEDTSVLLAMTEIPYDKEYARKCGVAVAFSPDEIRRWEQKIGRRFTDEEMAWATHQIGNIQQIVGSTCEEILEGTLQIVESNLYQIVVINSFGALLTKAEEEAKEGIVAEHYGGAAQPVTRFMHRLHASLNLPDAYGRQNQTTVLGINQYRENLGRDAQWNPLRIAGGRAMKHGKLISVLLADGSRIKTMMGTQAVNIGKEINWEVLKGKVGCHDGPKGKYNFYHETSGRPLGADLLNDLIVTAGQYNVISVAGSWISYEDGTYQLKAQGAEKFAHDLSQHPELAEVLRTKVFEAAGVSFIEKEEV